MVRSKRSPTRRSTTPASSVGKVRRSRKPPPERWSDYGHGLTPWTLPGEIPLNLGSMQAATSAHHKAHGAPSRPQQRRTAVPSLEWLALRIVEQGKEKDRKNQTTAADNAWEDDGKGEGRWSGGGNYGNGR